MKKILVILFSICLVIKSTSDIPKKELEENKLIFNKLNEIKNKKWNSNDFTDYLKEISVMDCSVVMKNPFKIEKDIKHILCPKALKKLTIRPIGKFNYNPNDFYKYLINIIYGPLGYKMKKKHSFSDLLNDLVFLDSKFSLIKGKYELKNFDSFNDDIGDIFLNMSEKTENLNLNKEEISDDLIKILKKFHIFWNTLRNNNDYDLLKTKTMDILKSVVEKYLMRQKNLTHITINLMDKIKESYYKFLRAHKMIEILKTDAAEMIINQIIKRYSSIIKNIKNNNLSNELKVQEISFILDLIKSFYLVNYRNNINDESSKSNLKIHVIEKIKEIYTNEFNLLNKNGDKNKQLILSIKYFTATILLKINHRTYIMFDIYNISQYVNLPKYYFENDSNLNIKTYYEFLDNMILIPEQCLKENFLKECTQHEINRILDYLNVKYQISDSSIGYELLTFLKKNIMKYISNQSYNHIETYKKEFFNNLSIILKKFRTRYYINDLTFLENLELNLGNIIESYKNKNIKVYERSINELDKAMYDEFVEIKADYNNIFFDKIDHNLILKIKKELLDFIDNFEEDNKKIMNHITLKLIEKLRNAVENWVVDENSLSLINQAKLLMGHTTHIDKGYTSALTVNEIKKLEKLKYRKENTFEYKKSENYPSISKFSLIKNTWDNNKL